MADHCLIQRRSHFSASHRYWLPELSPEENQQRFGLASHPLGHGHNYELFVSMAGVVNLYGMVLNLSDVKQVIHDQVTGPLESAHLNSVWPEFSETLPTTENIARVIWHRLAPHLPLVKIQLFEHPQLWAEYYGNSMEAYLTTATHFSAAHRLALPTLSEAENYQVYGKCARPNGHGHNYHLEVTVRGTIDSRTGMVVELGALHRVIDNLVIEPLDHTFLNKDIPYFDQVVPTAENIALHIRDLLQGPLQDLGVSLYKVRLVESPNNSCEVFAPVPAGLMPLPTFNLATV